MCILCNGESYTGLKAIAGAFGAMQAALQIPSLYSHEEMRHIADKAEEAWQRGLDTLERAA